MNYRVMKTNEFENAVYYEIACSCGDNRHNIQISFEKDPDLPDYISLIIYKDLDWTDYWGEENIFKRLLCRIKAALRILFTGHIEVEGECILQGEEHINSFINALEEGKNKFNK